MPSFRYTAISAGGALERGLMQAASEAEVIARLQRQGSMPMRAEVSGREARFAAWLTFEYGRRRGLRKQEVADLVHELSIMLEAGQDLDRALRQVQETAANRRVRQVVSGLRDAVRDGAPLSVALQADPASFHRLHVGLVRAGETGGKLAASLSGLAELLSKQLSLTATVGSALTYPCLLLVAAAGSITLLLTQVLPQFVPMFEQSGAKLPASTQFLMNAGDAVSRYWALGLVLLLTLLLAGRALLRRPAARAFAHRALLRLPLAGSLAREVLAARFTRVLGTLLVDGVPLITALDVVRDAVGNLAVLAAIEDATASARGGGSLSRSLEESGVFPRRTIQLLRMGEENAQLGAMSLRAADMHQERTRLATQRLVALLVPLITVLMGLAVAGIVASLMAAMLSLNDLAGA